jgi:hypothetical protein
MIYALLLAAQLIAVDTSFADAKARTDEYESVLSTRDSAALIEAQGKALSAAMADCGPDKKAFPPFTIVARVSNDDSPFAACLEQHLTAASLPVAAGKPFYASYELDFAP